MLKIVIGVTILAIAIYLFFDKILLSNIRTDADFSKFANKIGYDKKSNTKSTNDLEVNIDKILINTHSGDYKYMKADMAFKMKDENNRDELQKNMSAIRDTILRYSSAQDSNKLSTPAGKQQYKENLKDIIYDSHGLVVEDIYFRDFVLAK